MPLFQIQHRVDQELNWQNINPVLLKGEIGLAILESGVFGFKFGDGVNAWNDLPYTSGADGAPGAAGSPGEKGDQGLQGVQGIQGEKGEQGIQGIQGEQGIQGIQGEKGDKGDQGPEGPIGSVELSSSVTSESTAVAANSFAVKQAYDLASAADGKIPSLSSAVDSTAEDVAATSYAVKQAYDKASTAQSTANTANSTASSKMTSFYVGDGDGTRVTMSNGKYIKFTEGTNVDINFTDTSSGNSSDEFDLTFTVPNASTSTRGCVQLSTSTSSSSTSTAATSSAVNSLRSMIPSTPNAYVTSKWKASDGSSWYRKWSDGFIEQGGTISSTSSAGRTISLPTNFTTTTYSLHVSVGLNSGNNATYNFLGGWDKTTSSFKYTTTTSGVYTWYAAGF